MVSAALPGGPRWVAAGRDRSPQASLGVAPFAPTGGAMTPVGVSRGKRISPRLKRPQEGVGSKEDERKEPPAGAGGGREEGRAREGPAADGPP